MELMKAIYSRRAVRDFAEGAVDVGQLDTLIQAAIQAPSAMNQQSWSFCVVSNAELLSHISSEAKAYLLRSTPAGCFRTISRRCSTARISTFSTTPPS